ncbi:unnamed protein product [Blepharisma stoltei]|uniref:TmcB/TmcC TPR repeats domain-containing protein n=1 Tax=Blepharisma stoltei TaxID=1481888 RepID=A0AAU9K190_9CILI|nr:unnamed protein product [Blepharisma stoltei]
MKEEKNDEPAFQINSLEKPHSFIKFLWKILKESIFGGFSCLYVPKKKSFSNLNTQKIMEILINIIVFLQISRLNWRINLNPDNQILKHWKIIGYASFDQICAESGTLYTCFVGFSVTVWVCALFILIFSIMSYYKKNTNDYLTFFPRFLVTFLSTIGFVPFVLTFMLTLKYSSKNDNTVDEYQNCENCNLNWGNYGQFASVFGLIWIFAITHGDKIFGASLRHAFKDQNLRSRSHSKLSIETNFFYFLAVVVYALFNSYSYYLHQALLIIYPIILNYKYIKYIPYYNSIENEISITQNTGIATVSAIFVLGNATENDYITVWLFWMVLPLIVYFALNFSRKQFKLRLDITDKVLKDQYDFEYFMRARLFENEVSNPNDIINKFSGSSKIAGFDPDKLFAVWETYYCIDVLSDERLGRIKLNKAFYMRSTLEGDFQVWKCKNTLEEHSIGFYGDISILYYILELESIKEKDEFLCHKLLDFWGEITADKPRMGKLYYLSGELSKTLDEVKKRYADLVKSFPNNIYCHELYGSLLMDILRDNASGFKLINKKESFVSLHKEASKAKFWKFSEINGFLIVSADPKLFGIVVYANSCAGQILSQPANHIIGSKLSNYIPDPFSRNHDEYLRRYLINCKSPDVESIMSYFLKNERGYLVGCDFKISLVSLINHVYFVVSLDANAKHREFALVSEIGEIYAHSELFPQIISQKKTSVTKELIDNLIPGVTYSSMKPLEPWIVSLHHKEILIVKIQHHILSTSFNFLILVNDRFEIEIWKRGEDTFQLGNTEENFSREITSYTDMKRVLHVNICSKASKMSAIYSMSMSELGIAIDKEKYENEDNQENKSSVKTLSVSQASNATYIILSISQRLVKESEVMLKLFKWILFFSTLAIISMNIILLVYIYQQIAHSNNLSIVKNFAGIMQEVSVEAYLAHAIDLSTNYTSMDRSYYKAQLIDSLEKLRKLQPTILDDYSRWSYCDHSAVVTENIIPVYNQGHPNFVSFSNLYDFVSEVLKHGNAIVNAMDSGEDYIYDEFFIIDNGIGGASVMLNYTFEGLISCEIEKLDTNESGTKICVYMGLLFLCILGSILIFFSFKLDKKYDALWSYIQNQANSAYIELYQSSLNRLSTYHNYCSEQDEIEIRKKKKKIKPNGFKTKIYIKFIGLCAIIVVLTSVYYFVVGYIFYPLCKENLVKRYILLGAFLHRISVVSEMTYWTSELAFHGDDSFRTNSGLEYPFSDPDTMFGDSIFRFNLLSKIIIDPSYRNMYSKTLKWKFFEGNSKDVDSIFAQGTYAASNALVFDASFMSFSNADNLDLRMTKFIQRMSSLQGSIQERTIVVDHDSRFYVENQFNSFFFITIWYCGFCLVLFLCLYSPMINREKRKLNKLQEISALIPPSLDNKNKSNNK